MTPGIFWFILPALITVIFIYVAWRRSKRVKVSRNRYNIAPDTQLPENLLKKVNIDVDDPSPNSEA